MKKYLMLLTVLLSSSVFAHGNVTPQGADSSDMPEILNGDDDEDGWVFENPYRNLEPALKEKVIKFGESAYSNNCAGCHGLHAQSGGINPDLRQLNPELMEDDEWFVERLRFGSSKGMPALGGILKVLMRQFLIKKHCGQSRLMSKHVAQLRLRKVRLTLINLIVNMLKYC